MKKTKKLKSTQSLAFIYILQTRIVKFYLTSSFYMWFLGYLSLTAHFRRLGYFSLDSEFRARTISYCIKLPPRAPASSFHVLFPASGSHFLLCSSLQIPWLPLLIHALDSEYGPPPTPFSNKIVFLSVNWSLTVRWSLRVKLLLLFCPSLGTRKEKWKIQIFLPIRTYSVSWPKNNKFLFCFVLVWKCFVLFFVLFIYLFGLVWIFGMRSYHK